MTADRVHFREEVVSCSDFPMDPLRCPHCQGQNLALYGNITYRHEEVWQDGVVVPGSGKTDTRPQGNFTLGSVECLQCQVNFRLVEEEQYRLSIQVSRLRDYCIQETGKDPMGGTEPC